MVSVKCDLCGSNDYTEKFKIDVNENNLRFYRYARNIPHRSKMTGVFHIVQCNHCELLYTNPRFTSEELKIVYSSNQVLGGKWKNFIYLFNKKQPDDVQNLKKHTQHNPKNNHWKFEIIDKHTNDINSHQKLKLLDIGCGEGSFVFDATKKGYDAYGIDLSPDRVKAGTSRYKLENRLTAGNIDDINLDTKYDIITLWDVIEHVESPAQLLKKLRTISHGQTKIFALTMSLNSITYKLFKKNWYYINPTQHLYYFSHATIKKMYESNGFEFIGAEMDNSKNKNLIHLIARIMVGWVNNFFFKVYTTHSFWKVVFRPFQRGISNDRMKKRLENLYPGKYVGRYHDNFVFVGFPKK